MSRTPRFHALVALTLLVGAICVLGTPLTASAQRWQWPEKPENLKVLPKDWSGKQLRPVMIGFTRALGVRCSYCHVGDEGQPLSEYDFASDDNPKKDVARAMLEMLASINDQLKEIEPSGPERVNMWCHTCHRGRPRPMTLAEELTERYQTEGGDAALAYYRELREEFYGRGAYDFGEGSLNNLGYSLLEKDNDLAIKVFLLNVEFYPESANVYDSLGEAYMKAGKKEQAIEYYRKSLGLDPENKNAMQKLEELEAGDE